MFNSAKDMPVSQQTGIEKIVEILNSDVILFNMIC